MSELWTDNQIALWAREGEQDVSNKINLIIDRIGLATTSSQGLFTLPDYCLNISRITYRGFKLDGKNFNELVDSQSAPSGAIAYSRPLFYIYNGFGKKTIKVLPSVGETTSAPTGDLFNATQISSGLIVEFYRSPDFNSDLNRIPQPMRNILVKHYILFRALQQDGNGLDLKASDFFNQQYGAMLEELKKMNNATFLARTNIANENGRNIYRGWKARPQLPPNYPQTY
jgi:hypothetical protein